MALSVSILPGFDYTVLFKCMLAIRLKHNPDIKKNLFAITTKVNERVITRDYKAWAATIEGQNAFAPFYLLCFA